MQQRRDELPKKMSVEMTQLNNIQEWIVEEQESGSKLLAFLTIRLQGRYSARFLKRIIEHNGCQINGRTERFASTFLGKGDRVSLRLENAPPSIPSIESERILYEDEALLIYNKPAGINCDEQGILKLLRAYAPMLCLVHRLDRDTTGVLVLAKRSDVFDQLVSQFKTLGIHKRYLAIVDGYMAKYKGVIENSLGKKHDYSGQTLWGQVDTSRGLYACTEWERLKMGENASLIACVPKTGRTHQIRVHMAEMGHPILGDYQYGKDFICSYRPLRYLLHAEEIRFSHPITGKKVCFTAPQPDDFKAAQQKLFKG